LSDGLGIVPNPSILSVYYVFIEKNYIKIPDKKGLIGLEIISSINVLFTFSQKIERDVPKKFQLNQPNNNI